jgi:hypothetical protein
MLDIFLPFNTKPSKWHSWSKLRELYLVSIHNAMQFTLVHLTFSSHSIPLLNAHQIPEILTGRIISSIYQDLRRRGGLSNSNYDFRIP